jgi:hypothetical protein
VSCVDENAISAEGSGTRGFFPVFRTVMPRSLRADWILSMCACWAARAADCFWRFSDSRRRAVVIFSCRVRREGLVGERVRACVVWARASVWWEREKEARERR